MEEKIGLSLSFSPVNACNKFYRYSLVQKSESTLSVLMFHKMLRMDLRRGKGSDVEPKYLRTSRTQIILKQSYCSCLVFHDIP